jgi:U3 small nucleolar RNA-associated protein 14
MQALPEADDAYTYLPSLPKRHRTSTVQLSLTKDEAIASAGPSRRRLQPGEEEDAAEDDMEARIRKLAMQIAEDGDVVVESDESDVDSELAWEEDGSDEERWGDVFRDLDKGKKGKGKKEKEVVKKVRSAAAQAFWV